VDPNDLNKRFTKPLISLVVPLFSVTGDGSVRRRFPLNSSRTLTHKDNHGSRFRATPIVNHRCFVG
jgi:hypothetical protein